MELIWTDVRFALRRLQADALFQRGPNGTEELTEGDKHAIDAAVASLGDSIFKHPIVIEGYST